MANCKSEFCELGSFGIVRQAKCDWRQSRMMSCDSELKERRLGPRGSDGEGKSHPETRLANDALFRNWETETHGRSNSKRGSPSQQRPS